MAKELVLFVLCCAVWGPYLSRHSVLFQCDNLGLVSAINIGYSKDKLVIHLLRFLWFFVAAFDIQVIAEHIAGVDNNFADMLPRNNVIQFLLSHQ